MGRNAKLRAGRGCESKRLAQRHQQHNQEYREGIRHGCVLDPQKLIAKLESEGGPDSLIPPDNADEVIKGLSPEDMTEMYGHIWGQLVLSNAESIDAEMKRVFLELALIPQSIAKGFMSFQGVTMLRLIPNHDWPGLRQFVIDLAAAPALQEGLKPFGLGSRTDAPGLKLFGVMNGAGRRWAQRFAMEVTSKVLSERDAHFIAGQFLPINDHIESAADLACGRVLCDAGGLVLHYRQAERLQDAELCLSFRSPDGLLSFFPTNYSAPVSPQAVRTLRRFVADYKGPKMAGKISNHPQAARLCRLIGLTIRNGHGFLGGRG